MAQKDKVKELVGRGLDSYHTRTLQQIDRINKKNKEQNHKISILSNELDNDYLTKTEEGSVVSLEHSKEGMVYLDELQGNTLVNYCTDGSKELTLNGDIDVEGTFVTTTEGVDGGKVDVLCEGNTLVNLCPLPYVNGNYNSNPIVTNETITITLEDSYKFRNSNLKQKLIKGKTYTVIGKILENNMNVSTIGFAPIDQNGTGVNGATVYFKPNQTGIFEIQITPTIEDSDVLRFLKSITTEGIDETRKIVIENKLVVLEGDYTGQGLQYFEGMKSVGQNDENGHKIEILSQNADRTQQNKKEILLNEPLRSIKNINKDRIVKIGNKWFIERNLAQITLDGTENWVKWAYETPLTQLDTHLHCTIKISNIKYHSKECANLVTDKFKSTINRSALGEHIYHDGWNDTICIKILQSKLETPDASGFKKWLQNNPIELIYELATPIYEPLEIEPTLNTYNDTTHISNNSIIPCTMKIQNSGYNAIIKPSTLYTVALDTNKSGTIGMNLGGAKVTTTNNVATITTPATLADDSLRIYGKGIKGSKVRLLEGDKTNWIPSHFEGMKSSFEDKFDDTDNTYKMEILSNNKNYFNYKGELNQYYKGMSIGTEVNINTLQSDGGIFSNLFTANHHGRGQIIKVKPYTSYIIKSTVVNSGRININTPSMVNFEYGAATNGKINKTFNTLNNNEICLFFHTYENPSNPNAIFYDVELILESNDNLDYIPNKSNKIQFSSIEPLRKWDRFVFVNGKLMIERNTKVKNFMPTTITNTPLETYQLVRMSKTSDMYGYNNGYGNWTMMDKYSEFTTLGDTWQLVERIGQYSTRISTSVIDIAFRLGSFNTLNDAKNYFTSNPAKLVYRTSESTYEEVPFELAKIILEGYENGTLFFDTNIPPTSTVTYAGETPIVKSIKLNKTEVLNNTNDINDNIIPYLCDMDYRIVTLELQQGQPIQADFYKLFGGVYEMLKRDILSKRLSKSEYGYRLIDYFNVGKLTEQQVRELEDLINE